MITEAFAYANIFMMDAVITFVDSAQTMSYKMLLIETNSAELRALRNTTYHGLSIFLTIDVKIRMNKKLLVCSGS